MELASFVSELSSDILSLTRSREAGFDPDQGFLKFEVRSEEREVARTVLGPCSFFVLVVVLVLGF